MPWAPHATETSPCHASAASRPGAAKLVGRPPQARGLATDDQGSLVVCQEHLYAGLSAYLLAGIFFGVFYWGLERTWSGFVCRDPVKVVRAIFHSSRRSTTAS